LYNYTGTGNQDPTLNGTYAEQLKHKCPIGDNTTIVEMVQGNLLNFDGSYYGGVLKNQGLYVADAALLDTHWNKLIWRKYIKQNQIRHSLWIPECQWSEWEGSSLLPEPMGQSEPFVVHLLIKPELHCTLHQACFFQRSLNYCYCFL
jgi:Peroxidase